MSLWLIRSGSHGQNEQDFIQNRRIHAWSTLDVDIAKFKARGDLIERMKEKLPEEKPRSIVNWAGQLWAFAQEMNKGDLVVFPLKTQRALIFGEITSDYRAVEKGEPSIRHVRSVKWISEPIPRQNFAQDLLFSFGAFMTVCRISRNNAEERIVAMRKNGWKSESDKAIINPSNAQTATEDPVNTNLEDLGRDQIARLISARFKGHKLTALVEAILKAQGYTTWRSPDGADGGVDILAGAGPLGFGSPRLCVEVKSESSPIDRSTVDKLLGAVTKFGAQEGLFVSWSGFKSTVQKELASSFFRVRLWSQQELLEQLFLHYERFDEDLKAELPLKRVWTVALAEDEA